MKKTLFLFFLAFITSRCTEPKKHHNEIEKIFFLAGGCYGHCPIICFSIDSTLTYNFEGYRYCDSNRIGLFTGKVTLGYWDTINMKLEKIGFRTLDSTYEQSEDDLSMEIIIYYDNNNKKHIWAQEFSLPKNVDSVFRWFVNSYKTIPLKRMFETHEPYIIPDPDRQ